MMACKGSEIGIKNANPLKLGFSTQPFHHSEATLKNVVNHQCVHLTWPTTMMACKGPEIDIENTNPLKLGFSTEPFHHSEAISQLRKF